MTGISLRTDRFLLRDFREEDRDAFLSYQVDPRYRALYDLDAGYIDQARDLFRLFLDWQSQQPRTHIQLGIFDLHSGRLLGSAGLRGIGDREAEFGLEVAPQEWGRFALALDVTSACLDYGFGALGLDTIYGSTASGNTRITKLARWFNANIVAEREGPAWMTGRGWREVDWRVEKDGWMRAPRR